jgi:RNA polymerase-binding transcription factor DksA
VGATHERLGQLERENEALRKLLDGKRCCHCGKKRDPVDRLIRPDAQLCRGCRLELFGG